MNMVLIIPTNYTNKFIINLVAEIHKYNSIMHLPPDIFITHSI